MTDFQSLEISLENVHNGVYFTRVTKLQCTDCNCTVKRLRHRFSLKYVPKISCLKNLRPCKTQPVILLENGARVRPIGKSVEISNIFTRKAPWWRLLYHMGFK